MKAMSAIRPAISTFLSVAVIVALIFACMPFVEYGINGMLGVYSGMADAVVSGDGGEYANGVLAQMDAGSQTVIGELGGWANSVIEKAGASDFVAGIMNFLGLS